MPLVPEVLYEKHGIGFHHIRQIDAIDCRLGLWTSFKELYKCLTCHSIVLRGV